MSVFGTNLTGNIGSYICSSEHLIPNFLSDCLPSSSTNSTNADDAEVVCDCCTTCCNDDSGCVANVPQTCMVEAQDLMISRHNRNPTCECIEVQPDQQPILLEDQMPLQPQEDLDGVGIIPNEVPLVVATMKCTEDCV